MERGTVQRRVKRHGFQTVPLPDAELFVEAVTTASGQPREKVKDVRKAARESWDEASRAGGKARGFPTLAETFGDDVAKHVAKWLGFSSEHGNARANGEGQPNDGYDDAAPGSHASRVIGAGTFMRSYVAISYTLDGILPSGYLYGITAKQGSGKTAWKIAATIAVAMNRPDVVGVDVEHGRVAYVSIENPTDFKMKLAVNCYAHNISYDEIEPRVAIIDGRDTPEQIYEGLKLDAEENGPFQLVCFDTFQAGFAAAGAGAFNDNEAVLGYVIRLRPLTTLPGAPSVLVAFHPTKKPVKAN
jgi:AAA domain